MAPLFIEETGDENSASREIIVPATWNGEQLAKLQLPKEALVVLIRRDDKFILPRGDVALLEDDVLTVIGTPAAIQFAVDKLYGSGMN